MKCIRLFVSAKTARPTLVHSTRRAVAVATLLTTAIFVSSAPRSVQTKRSSLVEWAFNASRNVTTLSAQTPAKRSIYYLVDRETLAALGDDIARFMRAVSSDTSTSAKIVPVPDDPLAIRQLLKEGYEQENVWGAFLIGSVPPVFTRIQPNGGRYLSDHFYRAFNAPFRDDDRDGTFEITSASNILMSWLPQIWVSRLKPSRAGTEGLAQLRAYFEKNLRARQSGSVARTAFHYLPAIEMTTGIAGNASLSEMLDEIFSKHPLYQRSQVDFTPVISAYEQRGEAIGLFSSPREIGYINVHGSPRGLCFTEPDFGFSSPAPTDCANLTSDMLASLQLMGPRYLSLTSCGTAQFTVPRYFAGEVLFSSDALFIEAFTDETFVWDSRAAQVFALNYYAYGSGATPADTYTALFDGDPSHFLGDPTIRLRLATAQGPQAHINCSESVGSGDYLLDFGETGDTPVVKSCEVTNEGTSPLVLRTRYNGWYATRNGTDYGSASFRIVEAAFARFRSVDSMIEVEIPVGGRRTLSFRFQPQNEKGLYQAIFPVVTNDPRKAAFRISVKGLSQ